MKEIKQQFIPFFQQRKAYSFETQFGVAVAGVQSGKTLIGAYWAIKKIQECSGKNGIIVAPTYKILQQATLKKFFEIVPELRSFYKEHKGEINLPDGSTIFIRSADNPLGIEGITAHWIWLDEGGMCSQLTWTVLRSRVSMTGGQILITTTPYNMGWLYTDFYKPWKDQRDPSLSFFTWKSIDNPYFNKEFYEAEKHRLPPEEFTRRYEGEFKKMTGLVWDLPESQIIAPIPGLAQKAEARIMGIDWGFTNPAAIIVCLKYDGNWYITDEWKLSQKLTGEILQIAQNKFKEWKISKLYPDPAEPDRLEETRRFGLPVYETNKDVTGGISYIRELIYQKKFWVFNTCKETLDEMSMYHYPEQRQPDKESKEEPEKFNDHLMDALRYAIYSYQPIQPQQFIATQPLKPYYPELGI